MRDKRMDISNKIRGLVWLIEKVDDVHKSTYRNFLVGIFTHSANNIKYNEHRFRGLRELPIYKFKYYLTIDNAIKKCNELNELFKGQSKFTHFEVTPIYVNANYFPKPLDEIVKQREVTIDTSDKTLKIFNGRFEVDIENNTIKIHDFENGSLAKFSNNVFNPILETYSFIVDELKDCFFLDIHQLAMELTIIYLLHQNQYYLPYDMVCNMVRLGKCTEKI